MEIQLNSDDYASMKVWGLRTLAIFAAGCSCGSGIAPRDGGPADADALPDVAIVEPCASDIRRVSVDVPALTDARLTNLVSLAGSGDRVLVGQTDRVDEQLVARLTVADVRGARIRSSEQALPAAVGTLEPVAFRGDDPYEVLWAGQARPFAAIVRFAADATDAAVPPGAGIGVYLVHAAAAAASGFVTIVEVEASTSIDIASIDATGARFMPFPATFGIVGQGWIALSDADARGVVFGVFYAEDGALMALRIDTTTWPHAVATREIDRGVRGSLSVDAVPNGVVIGSGIDFGAGARFYWVDDALAVQASWDALPTGYAEPLGAAGAPPNQMLAFGSWDASTGSVLFAALVDAPGVVRGGARPLVNGLPSSSVLEERAHVWESGPGERSIAFRYAGVEVVTLCGSR